VEPLVINNVFALGPRPAPGPQRPLSVYWFSQTIGPRRGLEEVVDALGRAAVPITLTLRGRADEPFVRMLLARAADRARQVDIRVEAPADPDDMVTAAAAHDVGVSFEDASIPHRAVCTPNKLFVYLSAGLAIAASPTPGQLPVLSTASGAFTPIDRHDTIAFESAVHRWSDDRTALYHARLAAWEAAAHRWHWDHPCERGALVSRVGALLR
jgi:hypothetical protein